MDMSTNLLTCNWEVVRTGFLPLLHWCTIYGLCCDLWPQGWGLGVMLFPLYFLGWQALFRIVTYCYPDKDDTLVAGLINTVTKTLSCQELHQPRHGDWWFEEVLEVF